MRETYVTGNLAADAEVLTSKNGENYLRFRLGNREFGDAENETRWYDVTMFSVPKIAQYLKKGTGVRVLGDYKDSIYNSEKYGPQINRNITAFKIDFWSGRGKKDENELTVTHETPVQVQAPTPVETPKATKKGVAAKAKTTTQASSDLPFPGDSTVSNPNDDDLPF